MKKRLLAKSNLSYEWHYPSINVDRELQRLGTKKLKVKLADSMCKVTSITGDTSDIGVFLAYYLDFKDFKKTISGKKEEKEEQWDELCSSLSQDLNGMIEDKFHLVSEGTLAKDAKKILNKEKEKIAKEVEVNDGRRRVTDYNYNDDGLMFIVEVWLENMSHDEKGKWNNNSFDF